MDHAGSAAFNSWSTGALFVGHDPQLPVPADWVRLKGVIHALYIEKNLPLKDVRAMMEREHSFKATSARMYKTRLAQWGYVKNLKRTREIDWQAAAVVQRKRLRSRRSASALQLHCREIKLDGPGKYLRYQKVSEDDLLAEAATNGLTSQACPVPIHSVSLTAGREAVTPAPTAGRDPNEEALSPTQRYLNLSRRGSLSPATSSSALVDLLTALEKPRGASLKAFTDTASTWGPTLAGSPSPSDDFVNTGARIIMTGIAFTEAEAPFCDPIESDLSLLLERGLSPDSLNIYSGEPMDSEPGCDLVQQDLGLSFGGGHSPDSLDLSCREPMEIEAVDGATQEALALPCPAGGRGEAWQWVTFSLLAFVLLDGGDSESSTRSLTEAATVFEDMLTRRDDLVFTALHLTVTLLHTHHQSEMVESIIGSAAAVARRLLKPEDPIRLTLEWETAVAGLGLNESALNSQMLRQIYADFETERTLSHPWTIAALYNLAWMLLYEGSHAGEGTDPRLIYTEAADLLQKVYVASCASWSFKHMQSITALTTLARAQLKLGEDDKAIENYKKAIHDCRYTLGRSHPYRLEVKRHLAFMYEKKGQKEKMKPLYWDVLRGRVQMFGLRHPLTEGSKDDLITLLKDLQEWEDNGPLEQEIYDLFENATEIRFRWKAF